ncbi:MAG: M48 family metalloprotease [Candidatus Thiodiazotropha taylori]
MIILGALIMIQSVQVAAKQLSTMSIEESDTYIEKLSKKKTVHDDKLSALGKKLAKASHSNRDFRYNFKILEKEGLNAVSLGNGSIYVYRGVMDVVKDDESYLAFILAHEIAHTVLRHYDSSRYLKKAGEEYRENFNASRDELKEAKELNNTLKLLKKGFSRQQEYDADRWAMFYLARIGVSPMEGVRALMKFKEKTNYSPDKESLASHPSSSSRITHAFEVMAEISDAIAHFEYGEIYLNQGKLEKAVKSYDRFLRIFPDSPEGHANLGLVYAILATKDMDKSDYYLDLLIAEFDTVFFLRGAKGLNEAHYEKAMEAFNEALTLRPDFVHALAGIGALALRAENMPMAKAHLERVVELEPDNSIYRNNLGVYFAMTDQQNSATEEFHLSNKLDPQFKGAYYNQGLISHRQKDYETSIDYFRNFINIKPRTDRDRFAELYIEESAEFILNKRLQASNEGELLVEDSLMGIRIGMSKADIEKVMGEPFTITKNKSHLIWNYDFEETAYIIFKHGRVVAAEIATPTRYQTITTGKGIGFGDTLKKVKKAYGTPLSIKKNKWIYSVTGIRFKFNEEKVVGIGIFKAEKG